MIASLLQLEQCFHGFGSSASLGSMIKRISEELDALGQLGIQKNFRIF
jgi:hypothetical protein